MYIERRFLHESFCFAPGYFLVFCPHFKMNKMKRKNIYSSAAVIDFSIVIEENDSPAVDSSITS
jgi:hypothetical protein